VASGTLPAMICWSSITPDSCGESPSVSALFDPFDPFAVSSAAPVSSAALVAVPPSRVLLPMSRVALFVALVAFRSVSSRWLCEWHVAPGARRLQGELRVKRRVTHRPRSNNKSFGKQRLRLRHDHGAK